MIVGDKYNTIYYTYNSLDENVLESTIKLSMLYFYILYGLVI